MNTTLCSGKSSMIIQKQVLSSFEINVLFFTFFAWGTQANYQRFQALQFPGDEEVLLNLLFPRAIFPST